MLLMQLTLIKILSLLSTPHPPQAKVAEVKEFERMCFGCGNTLKICSAQWIFIAEKYGHLHF